MRNVWDFKRLSRLQVFQSLTKPVSSFESLDIIFYNIKPEVFCLSILWQEIVYTLRGR